METFTHILESFDIFQLILSAFPQIFTPVVQAFQGMFVLLYDIALKQFAAHPGLISGTIMFLLVYLAGTGLSKIKRHKASTRPVSVNPSH